MVWLSIVASSVQFSHSVVSHYLRPHGLQHARLPSPSPTSGVCSHSWPLSQWSHPTISSSVVPFSSCLQSFPASGSFPRSLFTVYVTSYWSWNLQNGRSWWDGMGWGGGQVMAGASLFRAEKPGVSRRGQQGPDYAKKKKKSHVYRSLFKVSCIRKSLYRVFILHLISTPSWDHDQGTALLQTGKSTL